MQRVHVPIRVLLLPVDVAVPVLVCERVLQPVEAAVREHDRAAEEVVSDRHDMGYLLLLGLGRVPQLLPTIDIPVIRMERVPRQCLLRLRAVRNHLSRRHFSDPLSYFKRQAHRVRPGLLEGLLAHADALVVHGQQRLQRASLRREDILGLPELPGLPSQFAVGDLRRFYGVAATPSTRPTKKDAASHVVQRVRQADVVVELHIYLC